MMQKNDVLKFGKHKGKTWGDLLNTEEGKGWLKWWTNTQSSGQYANYENKQKALIKEWLGEAPKDTRTSASVIDLAFMASKIDLIVEKLEIIERLLNVDNKGQKTTAVKWDEEQ